MHINPYLIIEGEKYLVDDFKFGFRQKPNAAGVPVEVPVFEGLHVVIRGHYPGFFLERWACASNQSKLVELVLKPLVLGSGPTRVFTFFDAHLVDFTKNYSEKKNPPVEMILKITSGGVRDSFSKSEYAAPWRETFEKPCTVVTQSTTEEACVDSGEDAAAGQTKRMYGRINHTFDNKFIAKFNEVYINVITPKSRDLQGPLVVFDSSSILFKTHSLARGSNSDRLTGGGNGDTPTGKASTNYNPLAHKGEWSYGNYGLIYLHGLTGEFKIATNKGRAGIAIHCGHTSGHYKKSLEDKGKLMGTYGCVRVYNEDMKKLGNLYSKFKKEGKTVYCYIEDYDGDIKDVYDFYSFEKDVKDKSRGKRIATQ